MKAFKNIAIILAILFISYVPSHVFSQVSEQNGVTNPINSPQKISLAGILDSLINGSDSLLIYENLSVDLGSFSIRKIERLYPNAKIDSGILVLNKSLEFRNCVFRGRGFSNIKLNNLVFNNCKFRSLSLTKVTGRSFSINGSRINSLRLLNSTFNNLTLSHLTNPNPLSGSISIFKTRINNELIVSNNGHYKNIGVFSSESKNIRFEKNNANVIGLGNNLVHNSVLLLDEEANEFRIRKNIFNSIDSARYTFDLNCDKLVFIDNEIDAPVLFADSRVSERVEMANNNFYKTADFHDMSFPEFDKYIPFSQFEEGFVVYENLYGEDSPDGANCFYCELYIGETDEELADKTNFDKLVQSYEILFLGYKSTGDIESANMSYIRIKDLYLNRLGYLYRTNGGFKHYFRWKLAQLLKFYTNHGTDPALSIVISIYVILIFAIFYVFFPSEWDVTSKARLISNFKDFVNSNEKGYMKPFLTLLIGFGISIINAITLSLNSFVTLGFGTIPTTGAARYVCIVQGFIGWFLLSIFTVSLINQILF
jgi:hypothetical protein